MHSALCRWDLRGKLGKELLNQEPPFHCIGNFVKGVKQTNKQTNKRYSKQLFVSLSRKKRRHFRTCRHKRISRLTALHIELRVRRQIGWISLSLEQSARARPREWMSARARTRIEIWFEIRESLRLCVYMLPSYENSNCWYYDVIQSLLKYKVLQFPVFS